MLISYSPKKIVCLYELGVIVIGIRIRLRVEDRKGAISIFNPVLC